MPEMRQRAAESYSEIRVESGAAILGLLRVPQVLDDAEYLKARGVLGEETGLLVF